MEKWERTLTEISQPCHLPEHFPYTLILGGDFLGQSDLTAAECIIRFYRDSESCDLAVTHDFSGRLLKQRYVGDLKFLSAPVRKAERKSIIVVISAYRGKEVFVSRVFSPKQILCSPQ